MLLRSILVMFCLTTFLAQPAAAKGSKPEGVASPVEDKAGADAATELDFKRLSAEATADGVTLTIETWSAWLEIPDPEDSQVAILVQQKNQKWFHDAAFRLHLEGGALVQSEGKAEGSRVDEEIPSDWMPEAGSWQAALDGRTITVTIPWAQFPVDEPRIQVWSLHAKENVNEETGETTVSYTHGRSAGVPTDDVPNRGKVLAISR